VASRNAPLQALAARYRFDVAVALLAPVAVAVAAALGGRGGTAVRPSAGLQIALALVLLAVVAEAASLWEGDAGESRDRGIVSAFCCGMLLAIPVLDVAVLHWAEIPSRARAVTAVCGGAIFTCGAALRHVARRRLGPAFSHAIHVAAGQSLVTNGPFRVVRHPAYLGTVAVLAGSSLMVGSYAGIVLVTLAAPAGLYRIRREEAILRAAFGSAFEEYARSVPSVWPFRWPFGLAGRRNADLTPSGSRSQVSAPPPQTGYPRDSGWRAP
jgi:protein-S-isoprenylcysteine O-methyltransferase Ste14